MLACQRGIAYSTSCTFESLMGPSDLIAETQRASYTSRQKRSGRRLFPLMQLDRRWHERSNQVHASSDPGVSKTLPSPCLTAHDWTPEVESRLHIADRLL